MSEETAEQKIAALERELYGTQEMMYHVLKAVGEPVIVPLENLRAGIEEDVFIDITENLPEECFIFSLQKVHNG